MTLSQQPSLIVQEDHFGAWGENLVGIEHTGNPDHKFQYNGIEKVEDFGLYVNQAVFRTHDPVLGRWWQVDPKANERESPYVAMGNNPILMVDMLGDTTNYYDSRTGDLLGTLYGSQGLNDRTISSKDYRKLMKEKYVAENMTIGDYNFYMHDPSKTVDDYLDTDEMEAYLNNADNVATGALYLNTDLGQLAKIGFAEFRGGNLIEMEAGMDITKNRQDAHYRGAQTMEDVVTSPGQYSSLRSSDPNKPYYDNPYGQARQNSLNFKAWQNSVSLAIKVMNGLSGISQGALFYYSPRSMVPAYSKPAWHTAKSQVVNIPGTRPSYLTVIK